METIKKIRRLNLRKIADEMGGQKTLAKKLKKHPNQIWQIIGADETSPYLRGISEALAREFEQKLHLPPGTLDKHRDIENLPALNESNYRFIPMINLESSTACAKLIISPLEENKMLFDQREFEKLKLDINNVYGMSIKTNDMFPTVTVNDTVVINAHKKEIEDGKVYALFLDHLPQIRRIFRGSNNSLKLVCDNSLKTHFPDKEILADEINKRIDIIGKVIAVSKFGEI